MIGREGRGPRGGDEDDIDQSSGRAIKLYDAHEQSLGGLGKLRAL
jgi:hypothetical protein